MWEYSQRTHLMQSWSSARQCPWTAPVFTVYKKGTGGSLRNKDHRVRTLCRRHIDTAVERHQLLSRPVCLKPQHAWELG